MPFDIILHCKRTCRKDAKRTWCIRCALRQRVQLENSCPGDVYLQCATTDDATNVMRAMGHRKYDGRPVRNICWSTQHSVTTCLIPVYVDSMNYAECRMLFCPALLQKSLSPICYQIPQRNMTSWKANLNDILWRKRLGLHVRQIGNAYSVHRYGSIARRMFVWQKPVMVRLVQLDHQWRHPWNCQHCWGKFNTEIRPLFWGKLRTCPFQLPAQRFQVPSGFRPVEIYYISYISTIWSTPLCWCSRPTRDLLGSWSNQMLNQTLSLRLAVLPEHVGGR